MKFGILGEAKISREYVVPAILSAGHEDYLESILNYHETDSPLSHIKNFKII